MHKEKTLHMYDIIRRLSQHTACRQVIQRNGKFIICWSF